MKLIRINVLPAEPSQGEGSQFRKMMCVCVCVCVYVVGVCVGCVCVCVCVLDGVWEALTSSLIIYTRPHCIC